MRKKEENFVSKKAVPRKSRQEKDTTT